jgi:hypothetical protein
MYLEVSNESSEKDSWSLMAKLIVFCLKDKIIISCWSTVNFVYKETQRLMFFILFYFINFK